MLPHPETVCMLNSMGYHERLREAASGRVASGVRPSHGLGIVITRSKPPRATWPSSALTRVLAAIRAYAAPYFTPQSVMAFRNGSGQGYEV